MRVVTQNDIKEINRLYAELGTYAATARATGFAPSTVKKYVIPGYEHVDLIHKQIFTGSLPNFDPTMFRSDDWGDLCVLSAEETDEIKELWKEIEI